MDSADELAYRAYQRGLETAISLIRGDRSESRTPTERRQRAETKLARTRKLLAHFGNPQLAFPTVHVTGTSGKGSTSAAIAAILTAAGYRAGLRTSPYLQVATEKLQIGSSLIDAPSFERLTSLVLTAADNLFASDGPRQRLTYAELWSVLSFLWFAERQVDIAVIEVGAGGRFDTTNVIQPLVSVITSVGLDHVVSLGPTIADIAWHKAGIIKRGSIAVVGDVPAAALAAIEAEAKSVGATLRRLSAAVQSNPKTLGMPGSFQQINARMATLVSHELRNCGFIIPDLAIQTGLATARLPGRLELMPGTESPEIWLDGAHNEDKIAALVGEVDRYSVNGRRPVVVLGILGAKDAAAIVARAATMASAVVVTEPKVVGKQSRHASALAEIVQAAGFHGPIAVERDVAAAVRQAEHLACEQCTHVLVTGSIYLVGEARRRWYPDRDVVVQRTPWPKRPAVTVSGARG